MKKLVLFMLLTVFLATILMACDNSYNDKRPYDMEKIDSALVKGNQTFAFDIFKSLNMEDLEESIFISPLSISQALTMAYNGAETTTKEGMEKTLGLSGLDRTIVNESFSNLTNYLEQIDEKIKLNIGNSIWIRDGEEIKEIGRASCRERV